MEILLLNSTEQNYYKFSLIKQILMHDSYWPCLKRARIHKRSETEFFVEMYCGPNSDKREQEVVYRKSSQNTFRRLTRFHDS